jgi:superfamily II DNA or RNA helicase
MLRTLNNPTNNRLKVVNNVLGEVFNTLEQTIIFCNSQAQAKQFYKSLNKALPGKVLISISEDGGASEEFDTFKSNPEYKVLLLVRKGRLGFSMKELYNIVDFTLSTNVDVISQMLGRVLRVGKKDKMKYYFKVSPQNTVWYFEAIMKIVLKNKMQDVFSTYDGNQNNVKLPKDKKRKPRKPMSKRAPNNERTPNFSEIDSDIISNIEFFKQVYHKGGQAFQTVSWTTLDDVRKECFNLRDRRTGDKVITYDECVALSKERGYTKKIEFQTMNPAHYSFIQTNGLMDEFVKAAGLKGRKLVLTYEEVKECADQCSNRTEFARKYQSKYKKAKNMGWLDEWFPEIQKSGPKEGSKNFKLNK